MNFELINTFATPISSIATAIGVGFVAWQIRLGKKQAQAEFEDSLALRVLS